MRRIICTRNGRFKAAEAGKHVLCEKPIALTVEEVDCIAAAATRHGVVVAEAFMYRHHPQTMMLKQLLGEGAIGELRYIRGSFTFTLNRPNDVRLDPAWGGGSLWDVGCYPVSLARVLAGMQPREVFGRAQLGATGIDEMFAGQLIFTDKLQAQFDCGFAAPFRTEAELVGTTGSIRVTRPFKPGASETLVLSRGDDFEQIAIDNAGELYVGEVEDMGKAIQEGTPIARHAGRQPRQTAVLVALYESARTASPSRCSTLRRRLSGFEARRRFAAPPERRHVE